MVPEPEFESYYGRQIIKTPTWKTPDVPLYLFLGGLAGASAVLAEGAALGDYPDLERVTRLAAAGGAGIGTVFLVHDLGRPARFLNMLRVFKITSPLSVGSWLLAPFATCASGAALSQEAGVLPVLGRLSGVGAAVFGPFLATYTGALLANTAVPVWHEGHRELPFVFAGSAAAAAGGLAMLLVPADQSGPARRMAATGAALDVVSHEVMERRMGPLLSEPYRKGTPGLLMRIARGLTLTGGVLSVLAGRSRAAALVGGAACVAGSVVTRFGVFEAGLASARDPKYTVIPQKQRLAERAAADHLPRQ